MTDKEIQQTLLDHYEKWLVKIKKMNSDDKIQDYIEEKNIDWGLCKCAWCIFNVNICGRSWIKKGIRGSGIFWCEVPLAEKKTQVIEYISFRINKLKKILRKK